MRNPFCVLCSFLVVRVVFSRQQLSTGLIFPFGAGTAVVWQVQSAEALREGEEGAGDAGQQSERVALKVHIKQSGEEPKL